MAHINMREFSRSHHTRCRNFVVLQTSIRDFDFELLGDPSDGAEPEGKTMLLFLSEPLWTLPTTEASPIYRTILTQAQRKARESRWCQLLVAYLSTGADGECALPVLVGMGAQLLHSSSFCSLRFGKRGKMYILKLPVAKVDGSISMGAAYWTKASVNRACAATRTKPHAQESKENI